MLNLLHKTKTLWLLCIVFLIVKPVYGTNAGSDYPDPILSENAPSEDSVLVLFAKLINDYPSLTDEEYQQRLKELSGQIDYRLDPLVKDRIILWTEKYRQLSEQLLGKGDIYFPVFEEYLAKYNIPHHLKYLAVIESHLNSVAKSPASAVGLWQFIPSSGRLFGLQIDNTVDERSDTHKASEAAAQFLSVLYDKYKDWALAMAAYNCGPGCVDYALKRSNATDYWSVRSYLPKETQNYVPYFMAMVYVGEYHKSHDLVPERMSQDLVLTDTIHFSAAISLADLSKQLNINQDTLKLLNPSYRRNFIPQSPKGQIIVLPARIVAELRGYDVALNRALGLQKNNPVKAVRRVKSAEDLAWLSKAHRCEIQDILLWNELPANYVPNEGDLIAIRKNNVYNKSAVQEILTVNKAIEPISLTYLKVTALDSGSKNANTIGISDREKAQDLVASAKGNEQVKAVRRHRIQLNESHNVPTAAASMPSANYYEKAQSSVTFEQLSSYNGNKIAEDMGNGFESSYSKTKVDKADYNFDETDTELKVPLITPELKTELQQNVQNEQRALIQKNNDQKNIENIVIERNRNRNLRGNTDNNPDNNSNTTTSPPR